MINNNVIRNCTISFPAVQGLLNEHALGKILIKNIYQPWQGENIKQIVEKHTDNPYSLRIGLPSTDKQLRNDSMYFILHYLAYNPVTKDIEMREIIPYRNTEKIYIGHTVDEKYYKDYKLFVDGNMVATDLYLRKSDTETSIAQLLNNITSKIEKLQQEIVNLKQQLNNKPIYNQNN